jgi:outer membrane immunogenic protein
LDTSTVNPVETIGSEAELELGRETKMKKILLTTVGLAALGIVPAVAADLPARAYTKAPPIVEPLPSWAGFYIGANGGGGWSRNCWDLTSVTLAVVTPVVPAISEGCHTATGAIAGGQIGYRWQTANYVFGLEAQGDWANIKGSNDSPAASPTFGVTNNTKIDAIGLFTGQVGYAWNNVLAYVKGGAAVTHTKYSGTSNAAVALIIPVGTLVDTANETRWGATVGAGVEFGFAPNWSIGLEYDHLFMGRHDRTFTFAPPALAIASRTESIRQDVDLATVRLNYRFGGPVVARY